MYSLSKSVPRGYEYLSERYSRIKPHKADVLQEYPPVVYHHQAKNFSHVSPLRNKKMLVEARTFRSPNREKIENQVLGNKNKLEKIFTDLNSLKTKFKANQNKLIRTCKENVSRIKSFRLMEIN
jgi:hypothetical protein